MLAPSLWKSRRLPYILFLLPGLYPGRPAGQAGERAWEEAGLGNQPGDCRLTSPHFLSDRPAHPPLCRPCCCPCCLSPPSVPGHPGLQSPAYFWPKALHTQVVLNESLLDTTPGQSEGLFMPGDHLERNSNLDYGGSGREGGELKKNDAPTGRHAERLWPEQFKPWEKGPLPGRKTGSEPPSEGSELPCPRSCTGSSRANAKGRGRPRMSRTHRWTDSPQSREVTPWLRIRISCVPYISLKYF